MVSAAYIAARCVDASLSSNNEDKLSCVYIPKCCQTDTVAFACKNSFDIYYY